MNRQQFMEYSDHFNHHRFDKVVSYFCPDVTLEYPDNFMGGQIPGVGNTLHGPQEFIANYQKIAANMREVLNVGAFFPGDRQFAVELVTEFHFLHDSAPGATGLQGKKGDAIVFNQMVLYDCDENGKFKRIRIFHHRYLDPSQATH
jgi:hypothetical protein